MAETVTFKNMFKKQKLKNLHKCKKFVKCPLLALKLFTEPTHFSFIIFSIKNKSSQPITKTKFRIIIIVKIRCLQERMRQRRI